MNTHAVGTISAPIVGAVHRAALMPDIRKTKVSAARCTAPTGLSDVCRAIVGAVHRYIMV